MERELFPREVVSSDILRECVLLNLGGDYFAGAEPVQVTGGSRALKNIFVRLFLLKILF